MKTYTKKIDGYNCEVEIDPTQDPSTQGWVTSRDGHTASMESVLQLGYIASNSGYLDWSIEVPEEALERIEDWANSVGY
jgi:hypothetical protein